MGKDTGIWTFQEAWHEVMNDPIKGPEFRKELAEWKEAANNDRSNLLAKPKSHFKEEVKICPC